MAGPNRRTAGDGAGREPTVVRGIVRFVRNRSGRERRLAVEACVALVLAPGIVRLLGVARSAELLRRIRAGARPPTSNCEAEKTVEAVEMASRRLPFEFSCLHRSMAAGSVLRLHGTDVQLRFGVRSVGGEFDGHAWLVAGGEALGTLDRPSPGYRVFDALESPWP